MNNLTPSPVPPRTPNCNLDFTTPCRTASDDPISRCFSEHVVQFSQPPLIYQSSNRSERRYTNHSRSDIYEEISLNLNSTPTTPQNPHCTDFTIDEDILNFKPDSTLKHKRVKSQPLQTLNSRCIYQRQESTVTSGKVKFNLGFSEILASLHTNAGMSISKHQNESMDWDISCVSNHQSCHQRKISDFDSVIYHDDDSINSKTRHDTAHSKSHHNSNHSKSHLESSPQYFHSAESTSIPELGPNPCTTYCGVCSKLVHTQVCFENNGYMLVGLLKFVEKLGCCHSPVWMNKYKVHQCIECRNVLARSGMGIRF